MLTKDLSQEKVLLSKRDGLSQGPQAIVYSAVDQQLFESNFKSRYSRNTVGCFKLTKDLSQENVLLSKRRARLIRPLALGQRY